MKEGTDFVASRSWLECFCNRVVLHNIKFQGKAASADAIAAEKAKEVLKQKTE